MTEHRDVATGPPDEYVEAPEVMGEAAAHLAAQDASGITGEVLYSQDLLSITRRS